MRRDDERPTSARWLALALLIAGVMLVGPALARTSALWLGMSSEQEQFELHQLEIGSFGIALASLQFPALVVLAMIMERAVRRVLR